MKFHDASIVIRKRKHYVQLNLAFLFEKYSYSVPIIGYIVIKVYWHFVIHRRLTVLSESNPMKSLALVPGKENVWVTYAIK